MEVAPYDGGLFDAGAHPYLSEHQMTNAYLSPVLYALACYEKKNSGRVRLLPNQPTRINYRDMSVRHLGTLYEGILEYKLFVAEEPMVVRPTKSGFQFLPETEAGTLKKTDRRIPIGGVYFAQNPGERKATGSYYTPEYIVEYIVQNTVGEKLKELKATLKQSLSKDLDALKVAISDEERIRFQRFIDRQIYDFVNERVLSFRVLDPAMGSGHFLVNATNAIANFITELMNDTDWENPELDTSTADWRRRVVESCIFGVDLNPLAVELSKLSLWITAAAKDRPLSFLDHHLKWGNSLIGVKLNELGRYPQAKKGKGEGQTPEAQMSLFTENRDFQRDIAESIRGYLDIEQIVTRRREDVEEKKEKLETIERILRPYREICELHTGGYFENGLSEDDYSRLITDFQPDAWNTFREKYDVAKVLARTADRRFFHWELEFPEVFFEEGAWKENPGFDAVIGNPPYGASFDELDRIFIEATYSNSRTNKNSAMVFLEQSNSIVQLSGMVGLIMPKSIAFSQQWETGRSIVLPILGGIADVSQAFENVLLEQAILVFGARYRSYLCYTISEFQDNTEVGVYSVDKSISQSSGSLLLGVNESEINIFLKVNSPKFYLRDISETSRGLPFQKYLKLDGSLPIYRGKSIARFALYESYDKIEEAVLENAKNKIEFLRQPKVMSQRIIAHITLPINRIQIMSVSDKEGVLTLDTVENTVVTATNYSVDFLTALLNSKFISWYAHRFIFCRAVRTMDFDDYYIGKIPVHRINFITPQGKREQLFEKAKELYLDLDNRLLDFVDERLKTEPEQSDVVHDLLAYLAEQMIEMNKQKQVAVKDFLTWLEGNIGCPIDELSGKTIIQGFYEQSVDKLLETLGKNAKKLSVFASRTLDFVLWDAKSPVFQEEFLQRYESQMAILRPLMERIQRTDELIDQIVYKLYGLTEEEINIVEGGMGNGR